MSHSPLALMHDQHTTLAALHMQQQFNGAAAASMLPRAAAVSSATSTGSAGSGVPVSSTTGSLSGAAGLAAASAAAVAASSPTGPMGALAAAHAGAAQAGGVFNSALSLHSHFAQLANGKLSPHDLSALHHGRHTPHSDEHSAGSGSVGAGPRLNGTIEVKLEEVRTMCIFNFIIFRSHGLLTNKKQYSYELGSHFVRI